MRIIVMGTGPFAVPTFESLLGIKHDVVVLVTRPEQKTRSRRGAARNPMREVAESHGLEVLAPDDINTQAARTQLESLRSDLFVVCDYGQILSAETLGLAPLGGINLHGSLLPKYRGAAPVNWAILSGEKETGVSVIHMTPKLDAGPCLVQWSTPIEADETSGELESRLAKMGVGAVLESIRMLEAWDQQEPIGKFQDPALATRAPRLKKADGCVNWSRTATQIRSQVRGLQPWPGTYSHWLRKDRDPVRLILDRVEVVDASPASEPEQASAPGTVIRSRGSELWVSTALGAISIRRVQPAGKRVLEVDEFLRGYPVESGSQFGTPDGQ